MGWNEGARTLAVRIKMTMRPVLLFLLCAAVCSGQEGSLVISQIYINDAHGTQLLSGNFVELFNRGAKEISLEGLSVQGFNYREAQPAVPLTGKLQPGEHYVVELGGGYRGTPLTADASGQGVRMSSSSGSVLVVRGPEAARGVSSTTAKLVDLLGFGGIDTLANGLLMWSSSGRWAYHRKGNGCTNTGVNAADFEMGPPRPRNRSAAPTPCPVETLRPRFAATPIRHAATRRSDALAPGTLAWVSGRFFEPGETEVLFDGAPAPLFVVEEDRILLGVPEGVRGLKRATMVVRVRGMESETATVELALDSPGIFTRFTAEFDAMPAVNEDGTWNAETARAAPGSIVTASVTGIGPTEKLGATLGGQTVEIAGVEPGGGFMRGLWKVRIRAPENAEGTMQLVIRSGDAASPPALVHFRSGEPVFKWLSGLRVMARDIVYDPFRNVLYAGTASTVPSDRPTPDAAPNSILVIDPRSRKVVKRIDIGEPTRRLALSSGGKYLWISLDAKPGIRRLNLETGELEEHIDLQAAYTGMTPPPGAYLVDEIVAVPGDEERLVVAGHRLPMYVLEGRHPLPRMGTPQNWQYADAASGLLYTEEMAYRLTQDGLELAFLYDKTVGSFPVRQSINDRLMDGDGVLRARSDLRPLGRLYYKPAWSELNGSVYLPETGLVYFGGTMGGPRNYAIVAYSPETMNVAASFMYYYHLLPEGEMQPLGSPGGRLVSIGVEGFATVYGEGGYTHDGSQGGDIFFYPHSLLTPVPELDLPPPQSRQGKIRRFGIPVQDYAVDPTSDTVYLGMSSTTGSLGNSILPFHTESGTFGTAVWVGSEPFESRVSANGRYLYVFLHGSKMIKRLRLPELQEDLSFPVLNDEGVPMWARSLLNVPGEAETTIAVARIKFDLANVSAGMAIYDEGVRRPRTTATTPGVFGSVPTSAGQFSSDGGWLFAINNESTSFDATRWRVTREGFEKEDGKSGVSGGFFARLRCFDVQCVTSSGVLFDPWRLERIRMFSERPLDYMYGSFPSDTAVEIDAAKDRAYFLLSDHIEILEISTGRRTAVIPDVYGERIDLLPGGELIVTGSDGLLLIPAPD